MANELDSIPIHNPTEEDFTWGFNGEPYTILAKEYKAFVRPVAFHLAKHLSSKMVIDEVKKGVSQKRLDDQKDSIHLKVSQLQGYDTHERRIALFKILNDVILVQDCLLRYPYKGFIGEMDVYKRFVDSTKEVKEKEVKEPEEEEEIGEEEEVSSEPKKRIGRPPNPTRTFVGQEPN